MIYEKLLKIQMALKAPKGQYNKFGKYAYRSAEDILEAVKPILDENRTVMRLNDTLVQIGDRYYIKATVMLFDLEDGTETTVEAFAREEETKKGMDGSQITGTASSYARKYAMNAMFLIDDTKDADTDEFTEQSRNVVTCDRCQNEVRAVKTRDGGTMSAEQVFAIGRKRYGGCYCANCQKVLEKERTNREEGA